MSPTPYDGRATEHVVAWGAVLGCGALLLSACVALGTILLVVALAYTGCYAQHGEPHMGLIPPADDPFTRYHETDKLLHERTSECLMACARLSAAEDDFLGRMAGSLGRGARITTDERHRLRTILAAKGF